MNDRSSMTLPVDPDVKIPAAVRRASEAAQAAFEAQAVTPGGNEEQPAAEEAEPTNAEPLELQEPAAEMTMEPAQPEPAADGEPHADASVAEWQHRYRSLEGRYAKLQRDHASQGSQIETLQGEIRNLREIISNMVMQTAPEPAAPLTIDNPVKPDEVEAYGTDFMDVVGRRAVEAVAPLLQRQLSQMEAIQRQLGGMSSMQAQTVTERLYSSLSAEVPNWRDLNVSSEFKSWLALPDPFSGAIRLDMLKDAFTRGDAQRVLAFFKGYLKEGAVVDPAPAPEPAARPKAKASLDQYAAPGRAKGAAVQPAPEEKPIITRSQITAFYTDVAAGRYRSNPEEQKRVEKMIFSAQAEGRVR